MLWQMALADINRVRLMPGMTIGLGVVVWIIYVTDRLLDSCGDGAGMDARHFFHRKWRLLLVCLLLPAAVGYALWTGAHEIPLGMFWHAAALALVVALYLAHFALGEKRAVSGLAVSAAGLVALVVISILPLGGSGLMLTIIILMLMTATFLERFPGGRGGGVPKELLAAMLFAIGTTSGVHFFTTEGVSGSLHDLKMLWMSGAFVPTLELMLLWLLFASNLVCIVAVEKAHGARAQRSSVAALWPDLERKCKRLLGVTMVCAIAIGVGARGGFVPSGMQSLGWLVSTAAALLVVLWMNRARFTPAAFRVLADIAVVAPLTWVFARGG